MKTITIETTYDIDGKLKAIWDFKRGDMILIQNEIFPYGVRGELLRVDYANETVDVRLSRDMIVSTLFKNVVV